ncbi:MAG: threonine/serine exporter family protein [Clostridia bacterium]|nr:threonine/serine exporter family protein [Clostridia bacterium]
MPEERRVLDAAVEAGHILLENGAEISRVEETMERICRHYGVQTGEFFVLSNGIFSTGGRHSDKTYARVQHIPVKGTRLDKVVAVNQLSREIVQGLHEDIGSVEKRIMEINQMQPERDSMQILASGVGSCVFCALAGGGLADCMAAFIAGFLLYVFVLRVSLPYLGKIVGNIFGGMFVVMLSLLCYHAGLGNNLSYIISGTIIPLVPGVAFVNGIRDIANGDYIAGAVRLLDAIFVFLSIAIGVGVVFTLYHALMGGVMP